MIAFKHFDEKDDISSIYEKVKEHRHYDSPQLATAFQKKYINLK